MRKGRHTRISGQENLWGGVKCQHSLGRFRLPAIPPEHLLKGCLLMALFSVRS